MYENITELKKQTEHNIKIQIKNATDLPIKYFDLEIGVGSIDFRVCSLNSRLNIYDTTIVVRNRPKIANIYRFV